jgi:DNA-binding FadR family transcriptional regulator
VARQLVEDIVRRRLPQDTPLPSESAMLQEYGVSRASLREALRILEVHGLLTIKSGPRGGPRIAKVDAEDFGKMATFYYQVTQATFAELAEARLSIEPMTARLAALHGTEEHLAALRDNIDQAKKLTDPGDERRLVDLSRNFHGLVAQMAGNRVLTLMGSSFEEIFAVYSADVLSHEENRKVVRMHERITEALIDHDGERAEALMRDHLNATNKDLARRHSALFESVVGWL